MLKSIHAWQFAKANYIAEKHGWSKFVSMQDLYNLLYREEEIAYLEEPYLPHKIVGYR